MMSEIYCFSRCQNTALTCGHDAIRMPQLISMITCLLLCLWTKVEHSVICYKAIVADLLCRLTVASVGLARISPLRFDNCSDHR